MCNWIIADDKLEKSKLGAEGEEKIRKTCQMERKRTSTYWLTHPPRKY